ncbi:MAG: glucosaminidase domain-containing protein [Tannerellaceae bacterium]|jgi:LysM repeat protein|nr:glucosaminidase domain-containing protein [Tannerellaceae bacterium]
MKIRVRLFVIILFSSLTSPAGSSTNEACRKYIQKYAALAIEQRNKYRIPASITLAQGIMESGAGLSELARKSNNHFGIKCHQDWRGGRIFHDDDRKGECFRKYKKVEDSYEDHSRFLERPRYTSLFKYKLTDYKRWAHGLQSCGYATDKAYASKLIKIIEDYDLHQFDKGKYLKQSLSRKSHKHISAKIPQHKHIILENNHVPYVRPLPNDDFERIAADLGIKAKTLWKYNEVSPSYSLKADDFVYLKKKKGKAAKRIYTHIIKEGDSMHSISQTYGIRLKRLYKLNHKKPDYVPQEGDVLKLR